MNYISFDTVPYFRECASVAAELGFVLVELQVVPQNGMVRVTVVIASKDPSKDIGVADCSKVHHALGPKIVSLLERSEDDVMMEVCSPGLERNIKNAAEFECFTGREIRVWDKNVNDWVRGKIKSSDSTQVTLETQDSGDRTVAYNDIAKAKFIHL